MSNRRGNLEDDLSASDDEAPEEIGMSLGKKQSLSQARRFHDQERISREAEKERRRKRNEMFRLQKAKKLENINRRAQALPAEVLEAVSAKSAKLSDEAGGEMAEKPSNSEEDDLAINEEGDEDRLSDSGVEDDSQVNECDFIPLDSTRHGSLNVVTLQNYASKKKSASEAALEFRNVRLFGPQCAPRESAKQRQAKRMKKQFQCK